MMTCMKEREKVEHNSPKLWFYTFLLAGELENADISSSTGSSGCSITL